MAAVIESSLSEFQVRGAAEGLDPDLTICKVHEFDVESAALIPSTAIGRVLSREETAALIHKVGAGIPKRPWAPSVRRVGATKQRAG